MTNEPQDLTYAEKAEYKLLSLNPFNNVKRQKRLEELTRKKQAYEEYQKKIYQQNQKAIATVMYSSRRDNDIKKLIDGSYSFVLSLLTGNTLALDSLIKNQGSTRDECKRVLEEIVDARVPTDGNFDDFFKRYNRYSAICIARFLNSAFGFTTDESIKATIDVSTNKILYALKDIILQYNLDFTNLNANSGQDFSSIRERRTCYNELVRVLNTEKYSNPSIFDTLFDWQEPASKFVVTTNVEISKLNNSESNSDIKRTTAYIPSEINETFTKLFDVGMQNALVLTQQNPDVSRELRNNRQTIFTKVRESSPLFISFAGARNAVDFESEVKKFMVLATSWGVYFGYKLHDTFSESPTHIISIIYKEIADGMQNQDDNLHLFATLAGAQKLIRARLDNKELNKNDQDDNSDFDNKVYDLRDWLISQDYGHANSDLLSFLISSANLYWSQLPSGMSTSRYASFECAVWSVFLCRFMLFSQLQKTHEFIDEFTKDIIEMLVSATSREYGFDKTQIDDFVWERFAAYDKIMMSNRENSQKTDAMLDYLVDLILYETSKRQLAIKLDLVFVPDILTRVEAYHFAAAFYEAVVTNGGEILRDRYAHAFYSFIY